MGYFDTYKTRLQAYGNSPDEVTVNNTKNVINNAFDYALFSEQIPIDGVLTPVIINQGKKSDEKTILLKPDTVVNKGTIVTVDTNNYLVMDFDTNKVYPLGKIKLCNNTYTIKTDSTQIPKTDANGKIITDKYGRPIMIVVDGTTIDIPCIAETKYQSINENDQLPLPDGRLNVTMQYNPSRQIKINDTFKMYNKTYRVSDYDLTNVMNGIGYVIYHCDRIPDEVA